MKVKELIEKLKEMDQEKEVVTFRTEDHTGIWTSIEEVIDNGRILIM